MGITRAAVVAVALAACRNEPSPPGEVNEDAGLDRETVDAAACARFGLGFREGCEDSDVFAASCSCYDDPFESPPPHRCNWGRYLAAYDCTEVCKHHTSDIYASDYNEQFDDKRLFYQCVSDRHCMDDRDCGGSPCVTSPGASTGRCSDGSHLAGCTDDADCSSKLCIDRQCRDGYRSSPCRTDADCRYGTCREIENIKACLSGAPGEACIQDSDCLWTTCYRPHPSYTSGHCALGEIGARCASSEQCFSFHCDYVSATCVERP